jgi:hypothetical protein
MPRGGSAIVLAALVAVLVAAPARGADEEAFARQVDAALDRFGEYRIAITLMTLRQWTREIVPWFAEEGITAVPSTPHVRFAHLDGTNAIHVAGYAHCRGKVTINARYASPVSSWHRDVSFLQTLAHELAHEQQGSDCRAFPVARVETGAQLMSFEVLAAMANAGNEPALVALLDELRTIALGALWLRAVDGDPAATATFEARFEELLTPRERALFERSRRWWVLREDDLHGMLARHQLVPLAKTQHGIRHGFIPNVVMSPVQLLGPRGTPNQARSLLTDDLQYLVSHLGELSPVRW